MMLLSQSSCDRIAQLWQEGHHQADDLGRFLRSHRRSLRRTESKAALQSKCS